MRSNLAQFVALSCFAIACGVAGLPTVAQGQERPRSNAPSSGAPTEELARFRDEALHARYRTLIPALRTFLARTDLLARQRNEALELLAIAQIANRNSDGAAETLGLLYRRDPDHRLSDPDASPVVQAAFSRAREENSETVDVAISEGRPSVMNTRTSASLDVTINEGADAIDEMRLSFRQPGMEEYARLPMTVSTSDHARARIPLAGDNERAYRVEYYIEALAPSGAALASVGSWERPYGFAVPSSRVRRDVLASGEADTTPNSERSDSSSSVLSKWWFWSAVGVVVSAAIVSYVVLGPPSDGPDEGSLGQGELR